MILSAGIERASISAKDSLYSLLNRTNSDIIPQAISTCLHLCEQYLFFSC